MRRQGIVLPQSSTALPYTPDIAWTPFIEANVMGNLAVGYAAQVGRYTEIGNLIFWRLAIVTNLFTHTTASGQIRIGGFPYPTGTVGGGSCGVSGWTRAGYTQLYMIPGVGNTFFFECHGSGIARGTMVIADFPSGGTINVRAHGFYMI